MRCKSSCTEPGFCLYFCPHLPRSVSLRLGTLSLRISTFINLKSPTLLLMMPFHIPLLFICTTSMTSPFCNHNSPEQSENRPKPPTNGNFILKLNFQSRHEGHKKELEKEYKVKSRIIRTSKVPL